MALAEKLTAHPPKERFDRVILEPKAPQRERHLHNLRRLVKKTRRLDLAADRLFAAWRATKSKKRQQKLWADFLKLDARLRATFPEYCYQGRFIEDLTAVADNVHENLQAIARALRETERPGHAVGAEAVRYAERKRQATLEEFVRMPAPEFFRAYAQ